MKFLRLLTVLAVSAITSAVFATQNARAFVTITSNEGIADVVNLYEDDAVTNYSECMSDQYATMGDPVNVWVVANSTNYSKVKLASLNNLVLKFKANSEESFTMSFTYVTGTKTISLKRSDVDTTIIAAAANTYEFTCDANEEITFIINPEAPAYTRDQLTVGDWGTICVKYNSNQLEGGLFYKPLGTKDADKGVALEQVTALNAGYPYVFQATATEIKVTYTSTQEATDTVQSGNMVGSFYGCPVPAGMYIIVDNKLYKAEGTTNTIGANRAYFDVAKMGAYTPAPGRKVVFFGGKSTPTDMEEVAAPVMNGKMIINGQLIIMKDGKMFNAQGMEL